MDRRSIQKINSYYNPDHDLGPDAPVHWSVEAFWTLYGTLKPYQAGDLVMLLKEIAGESAPDEPRCCCFQYAGDNPDCPVHKRETHTQQGPEWTAEAVRAGEPEIGSKEWFDAIPEQPF